MKKMLIVTTVNDFSVPYFLTQEISKKVDIDFIFFHEDITHIKKKLVESTYDFIYVRDPFNTSFDRDDIEKKFSCILEHKKESYIVDNLTSIDDIYLEDKWNQYQVFSEHMPTTTLLKNKEEIDRPGYITKKRISSRAKGIIFNSNQLGSDDISMYIIQKMISIDVEYRVNVIFNEVVEDVTIKNSKTDSSKVSIIGSEKISARIKDFVQEVIQKNTFDFIGLDIAVSGEDVYLIELNRSCLFGGHFRATGDNLAVVFIESLLKKYR